MFIQQWNRGKKKKVVSWDGGNLALIKSHHPHPKKPFYRNRETSFKQFFYNTSFMWAPVLDLPSDRCRACVFCVCVVKGRAMKGAQPFSGGRQQRKTVFFSPCKYHFEQGSEHVKSW